MLAPRFIVLARDITERKAAEQRIMNLAHYDTLTGLPNRVLLADRMKVAIQHAARHRAGSPCCSSTSTASSLSMIPSVMISGTSSSRRWR